MAGLRGSFGHARRRVGSVCDCRCRSQRGDDLPARRCCCRGCAGRTVWPNQHVCPGPRRSAGGPCMRPLPFRVAAPGNLYVAGEYAVVTPGQPAILIAVDRYVTVTVTEAAPVDGPPTAELLAHEHGVAATEHNSCGTDYALAAWLVMDALRA